jgi:hypothetical protein
VLRAAWSKWSLPALDAVLAEPAVGDAERIVLTADIGSNRLSGASCRLAP